MKIPKSWKDVTLAQLIEINATDNDQGYNTDIAPALSRAYAKLAVLTGSTLDEVEALEIEEVKNIFATRLKFLEKLPEHAPVKWFMRRGILFKINHDISKLTFGSYIDFYELTKKPDEIINNAVKILSVFVKPVLFKISDEKKMQIISRLPVSIIYPLTVFFCNHYDSLMDATLTYLKQVTSEMKAMETELQNQVSQQCQTS